MACAECFGCDLFILKLPTPSAMNESLANNFDNVTILM